jgi:crotonobetainyl-CoA:carnitine CoA-transferase CaiB-like acyl-CoA transferase
MNLLHGIKVLDLTRVLAGPYCTMLLGDYGADVIKVERLGIGDDTRAWGPPFAGDQSTYYLSVNRNKRSIELDLKTAEGKKIVRDLACKCDIMVENFAPGTLASLDLSPASLMELNPRLIACSISGYGQTGPDSLLPGFDMILQARGGIMSVTGQPDAQPSTVGLAVIDLFAGLHALNLILAALQERQSSGRGHYIDTSLLDSQFSAMTHLATGYLNTGKIPTRRGNAHNSVVPYQTFKTSDGYVNIAGGNDSQWKKLCLALGLSALAVDPRFATNTQRVSLRTELIPLLELEFLKFKSADIVQRLTAAEVPVSEIQDMAQVCADPQVLAREMIATMPHPVLGQVKMPASPGYVDGKKATFRYPPPLLGQHTQEILKELYS